MKSSRRQLIGSLGAAAISASGMSAQSSLSLGDYQIFWGDLHNHNSVGYARGSLERSYEIAREHLDFYAFTPHAQWHDMLEMPNKAHEKWAVKRLRSLIGIGDRTEIEYFNGGHTIWGRAAFDFLHKHLNWPKR